MTRRWLSLLGLTVLGACSKSEAPTLSSAQPAQDADSASSAAPAPKERPARPRVPPAVTLSGESQPLPATAVEAGRPRVHARALRAWIHERPSFRSPRLGYLRVGSSSPTTDKPAGHEGCKGGWYAVEPDGYVCVGKRATLDANDPVVKATREHPPDPTRKLPYIYGTVRKPGPIYGHLPSAEELGRAEPDLADRMQKWLDAEGEIGAGYAQEVWLGGVGELVPPAQAWADKRSDPLPAFLQAGAQIPTMQTDDDEAAEVVSTGKNLVTERMRAKVGYSFFQTFLHEGRRYGVTTDLKVMPTDRLRPIRGSDFHGFEIPKQIDFPFAIVRRPDAKLWLWQKSANKLIDAGNAPYRGAVKLSGKQQFFKGRLHYETSEGKWLSDKDASRLDPAKRMPAWGKSGEKWMDVNLTKQTVVLYEGEKPVYATLISSGEAGLEDPKHTTATKRGIFRIHTKHVTATMSSDEVGEEFELRDVPYVQYFDKEGYALHGAYWHDRFGVPKSHGCINLAPEDARRIFHWTEPQVPVGWHGVLLPLKGTIMFVHP
ncbi:MAG: L,D-transpeptidase [Polyangiaceae bacterium]|nr:L,D-transpeptidase [Polyangiaceae bacterium]MCL4748661.1 L,D-transpeptidase [Myxococcales bacterium]